MAITTYYNLPVNTMATLLSMIKGVVSAFPRMKASGTDLRNGTTVVLRSIAIVLRPGVTTKRPLK